MKKDEIVQAVHQYILEDKLHYAILINGSWGSGKTYLYKTYLVNEINSIEVGKNERKTNIYISLYGISNIEDLAKEVLSNFMIYSIGKGNKKVKKAYKPVEGILDLATKAVSFSIGPVSADFSQLLKSLEKMINPKDMVICFDDLERCAIPVNEFFGFVNNLVEHCNSKVIVLADEENIGKIYANTNIENKYQAVLSGNRMLVETRKDNNIHNSNNSNNDITIDELKALNERLFSENYLYKDIKEKVIGMTFWYYPDLKETLTEIISGEGKEDTVVKSSDYRKFLLEKIDVIVSGFNETHTNNIRIIINWIIAFEPIYLNTQKEFKNEKYYDDIILEFLRYSIWVAASTRKNKKIKSTRWGNGEQVHYEGNEYTSIYRFGFIDAWIKRNVMDKNDLRNAAKTVIERKEREDEHNPRVKRSEGTKLMELREWFYMSDEQVCSLIDELVDELKDNKYVYLDYSTIICRLMQLKNVGLFDGNLKEIQELMMDLIDHDSEIQYEDDFPKTFETQEQVDEYNKIYAPISARRKVRNQQLDKEHVIEDNVFKDAQSFYNHCEKKADYYCTHHSFTEYVNIEDIFQLVKKSSLEDIYEIVRAFKKVYYMSNVRDFYEADIDNLVILRNKLLNSDELEIQGKTHKYAIDYLVNEITSVLRNLGYSE